MENLIKALQIFLKYNNEKYPTHCEHDTLHIMNISWSEVSEEDRAKLKTLGFIHDTENGGFISFFFGSA